MDDLGRCRSSAKLLESWWFSWTKQQFGGFGKATLSPTIIMKSKITASWRKATHFQQNISTSMIMRKKGDKLFYRNLLRSVISGPRYWDVAGAGYFLTNLHQLLFASTSHGRRQEEMGLGGCGGFNTFQKINHITVNQSWGVYQIFETTT